MIEGREGRTFRVWKLGEHSGKEREALCKVHDEGSVLVLILVLAEEGAVVGCRREAFKSFHEKATDNVCHWWMYRITIGDEEMRR